MADDLEKAIIFDFDQTGSISPELKQQAHSYLDGIKQSSQCWELCLNRFDCSNYVEVKFWCLQTLHELIKSSYRQLSQQDQLQVKQALIVFGSQRPQLPTFLRNKVAQAVTAVAAQEYPDVWPTFFHDVIGILGQGTGAVDLFCRILVAVDEDIISLEVPRSAEDAKQSMHFKDSMRDHSLAEISEAWTQVVGGHQGAQPEVAAFMLETVQRYVHWVDIGLVANSKFMPLLFSALNSSSEHLRGAAADVLTEVVSKRMEAVPKLTLIQQLGVVPVCAGWQSGLPSVEEEPDLAVKYSKLLATLATEVLEAWKKVENSVLSMAAVGLAVDEEASSEAGAACTAAASLLDQLFPAVLASLRTGNDEIAATAVPFLMAYVTRLKAVQKRMNGSLPPHQAEHVPAILEALAACARFSDDSAAYEAEAASASERVAAAEEETAVADRRQDLFTLFRNTAKLSPDQAYSYVGGRLSAALSSSGGNGGGGGSGVGSWQEVELAVSLLYQLGEGAPDEAMKAGSGALAGLAVGVMQAEPPCTNHRLVALALMETYVRYWKVLQQAQQYIPKVISAILGDQGIAHPSESVGRKACYLFCRLAKYLRAQLRPLLPEILQSLQPHLARIAASPSPESPGSKSPLGMAGKGFPGGTASVDDRLYAFEAVGLLLSQEDVPPQQQQAWLAALLQPLVSQIDQNLALVAAPPALPRPGASPPAVLIQQALEALTRLSKSFGVKLCTEARPELGVLFKGSLNTVISIPRRLPSNKPLRARFISFLHRMVESLGSSVLPYLPPSLEVLLHSGADAQDLQDVLALLNQLMTRFKGGLLPLMKEVLAVIVGRVHSGPQALLPPDWDWSGAKALPSASVATPSSPAVRAAPLSGAAGGGSVPALGSAEDMRERGELQKAYYSFLHALAHNELTSALLQTPPGTLDAVLGALMQGAGTHVDSGVRKTCIQVLGRLAREWLGEQDALPGFRDYVIQQLACEVCLESLVSGVDVRDAAAISLLTEVSLSLKLVHEKCGQPFLAYLCSTVLPRMGWPPAAQQQLVMHITQSDAKQLKDFLKAALLELKAQGSTAGGTTPPAR